MVDLKFPIIATAFLFAFPANAFYVTAATPAGWALAGGVPTYSAASASAWIQTSSGLATAAQTSINVGGRAIAMPALLRAAPSVSGVLARAVFMNPILMLGVGAAAALAYYSQDGFFIDPADKAWKKRVTGEACTTNCRQYWTAYNPNKFKNPYDAANAYAAHHQANNSPRLINTITLLGSPYPTQVKLNYTLTAACCGGIPAGYVDNITTCLLYTSPSPRD